MAELQTPSLTPKQDLTPKQIVERLDNYEHLPRFLYVVPVGECVAFLATLVLEDNVAFLNQNWRYLHCSYA